MTIAALPAAHIEKLTDIRRRLANLSPDYANPHRFYRKRDDLVDEIVELERGRR